MAKKKDSKHATAAGKAAKVGKAKGKKKGALNRLATVTVAALVVGSVVQELRKPIDKRTWEGRVAGVPYDYRMPSADRLRSTWWAPEDARLVVPTAFGLGWNLNVGRLVRLAEEKRSELIPQ